MKIYIYIFFIFTPIYLQTIQTKYLYTEKSFKISKPFYRASTTKPKIKPEKGVESIVLWEFDLEVPFGPRKTLKVSENLLCYILY